MSELLLEVKNVHKRYPVLSGKRDQLRALWKILLGKQPAQQISILEEINFVVNKGQSLAIVGENGAGKSTLLKIISKVIEPSEGSINLSCKVGVLIELGAGFHREYSGRDNVRMQAAMYGLAGQTLQLKMHEIEQFADIGHYFDEPVKHYSTGMIVRLGFAIIAAVRPPLLITDEVLRVGDESFQKKCIRWLDEYMQDGGTLLLVSHSMYHVQKLCRHALWLKDKKMHMLGNVSDVTREYLAWHEKNDASVESKHRNLLQTNLDYYVENIVCNQIKEEVPVQLMQGGVLSLDAVVYSRDKSKPVLLVGIVRADGTAVYGVSSEIDSVDPERIDEHRYRFQLVFDPVILQPGSYILRAHAMDTQALRHFDTLERGLTVLGSSREFGLVQLPHHWIAGE